MTSSLLRRKELERLSKDHLIEHVQVLQEKLYYGSRFKGIYRSFFLGLKILLYKVIHFYLSRKIDARELELQRVSVSPISQRIWMLSSTKLDRFDQDLLQKITKHFGLDNMASIDVGYFSPVLPYKSTSTIKSCFGLIPKLRYQWEKLNLCWYLLRHVGEYQYVILESFLSYKPDLFLEEILLAYFIKTTILRDKIQKHLQHFEQDPRLSIDPLEMAEKLNYLSDHSAWYLPQP